MKLSLALSAVLIVLFAGLIFSVSYYAPIVLGDLVDQTPTPTPTDTSSPSATPTASASATPTPTPTSTASPSATPSPSVTPSPTPAPTNFTVSGTVIRKPLFSRWFNHNQSSTNSAGIRVDANEFFTHHLQTTTTDTNGNFSFTLSSGMYFIEPRPTHSDMISPIFRLLRVNKNYTQANFNLLDL